MRLEVLYEMKDEVLPEFQYILDQPIELVISDTIETHYWMF